MVNFILVSRKHGLIVEVSSIFLFLVLHFNRAEFAKWRVQLVNKDYISKDLCILRGKEID